MNVPLKFSQDFRFQSRSLAFFSLILPLTAFLSACGGSTPTLQLQPDFSLSISPSAITLMPGAAGQKVAVTATAINGFANTVTVSLSGLPAGVQAQPATLTLTPGVAQSITVAASASTVAGSAMLTLSANSGTLTHTITVAATIASAAASPDFVLSVTPASLSITAGATGSALSVKATAVNGFSGNVMVAITGLPAGVTANPASLTLAPGVAQPITITADASAAAGSAKLTLSATSGTLTHTVTEAVTIAAAPASPDFALSVTPASLSITAGATGSALSVKATAVNGFSGKVTVAIAGLPAGVAANPASLTLTPGTAQSTILTAGSSAVAGSVTLALKGTSGSLAHSANVSLTITSGTTTPSPDFTLSVSPASLTLAAGVAGSSVSVKASAVNAFTGTVGITLAGLPSGVTANPGTLSLTPGTAQSLTLTASSAALASASTLTFTGTSGSLTHAATLALTVTATTGSSGPPDVTTYHYDLARDGLNAQETILNSTNVNSAQFGKIGFDTTDGPVDAEPLFLANLSIGGQAHNVLYLATEHGSVYAFDADSGSQLWQTSAIPSGESPSDDRNCNQIPSEIGITSTPVIDRTAGAHGTLFTVAMSKDTSGSYHQRLHALDLTTGAEIGSSPTEIAATYPGAGANSQNGNVIFDPAQYAERAALLLLNGNIYTAWTSHCDQYPYTGWLIAYGESTLQQTQVLNLTPNGGLGSIWMAGDGPAADSSGNIYLLDANGTFDNSLTNGFPAQGDFGNAMVRISTQPKLTVSDYFETYNTTSESNSDLDLGSGGEILLPALKDASGVTHALIVGAGKDKNIYLADRTNLGKYNPSTSAIDSNIYQIVSGALAGPVFSTPAYFNGVLYYGAVGDSLKAFPLTNAKLPLSAASQSAVTFGYPGTTPAVSANGSSNGIVWAVESNTGAAAVLHAYDPANLAHEFYNSTQAAQSRDSFGNGNKFITPLVVNGKVYVGTPTGVAVFGLLAP